MCSLENLFEVWPEVHTQHSVLAKCLISDKFKHVIDVFPMAT